jgi:hypothetical protein
MSNTTYIGTYISPQTGPTPERKRRTQGATMLDGFPVQAFSNGVGVVTVIVIIGWMVFTGRLVPRRFYDAAVKRGDNLEEANRELLAQNTELITDKDLSLDLLRAIRGYAQAKRGEEP